MKTTLIIFQVVVSVLLILSILSQEKGVGLGAGFGGGGQATFRGRRGVDRVLLWVSILLAILFIGSSLAFLFLPNTVQDGATPATESGIEIPTLNVNPNVETEAATPAN